MKNNSTRLNPYEFLEVLQKEYFVAYLRSKIYHSVTQKAYFRKVMSFKKEKILDVSKKNKVPSIFSDEELYEFYKNSLLGNEGYPDIKYKNIKEMAALEASDITNYYLVGEDARVVLNGKVRVGKITKFNIIEENVTIKFYEQEKEQTFPVTKVTRVIS